MSAKITLILGGARSGKSRRAETLAAASGREVVYVSTCATALADAEMQERIRLHREQRPAEWTTVENEFDLPAICARYSGTTLLLDCLTLWLSYHCESVPELELLERLRDGLKAARLHDLKLLIVSNEMGMGLVPSNPLGRSFRDLCGRANQLVAAEADHVEFQIAGLPLVLKGGTPL
jgi:adenosylcobinamide kinase/adenosylcobinamide-phosphate guanylyltransferase